MSQFLKKVNLEFLLKTTNTVIVTTLNYCLGLDPRASGSGLLMVSDAGKDYDSSKSSLKQHFPHSPGQCALFDFSSKENSAAPGNVNVSRVESA